MAEGKYPGTARVLGWSGVTRGALEFGALCSRSILGTGSFGAARVRSILAWCFAGVLSCQLACGQTPLEAFKNFTQNPPTIAKMVAKVCDAQGTNHQLVCYYVLLRYQTNGFYCREVPRLEDLASTNVFPGLRFAGWYGDEYWDFGYDGGRLDYSTNRDPSLVASLDNVFARASCVLDLGVYDLLPHSLAWNGTSLVAATSRHGVRFEGNLVVTGGELPASLALTVKFEGHQVPWEIRYEYGGTKSVPSYLPTTIMAESLLTGSPRLLRKVELLTVEIAPKPLPQEYFSPGAFAEQVRYQILATKDGRFTRDRLNPVYRPLGAALPGQRVGKNWIRLILLLAIILPLAGIFALRIGRAKNKPTKTS